MGERASSIDCGRPLLGFALLKRLLHLAHHGLLDLLEINLDGLITGLRLGPGHRHLLGLGPVDRHSRLGAKATFQGIDQTVERRIGQWDLCCLFEPSKRDGLIGVAGIARHLRAEPLERAEAPSPPCQR